MARLPEATDAARSRSRQDEGGRDRARGRGAYVNYYDDMGMASTEEGHGRYVSFKKKQDAAIAKEGARISQLNSQLSKERSAFQQAQGELSQFKSALDTAKSNNPSNVDVGALSRKAYDDAKRNGKLVPTRVVSGNNVEATYWIPRDALITFNGMNAGWVDNGKNFNVEVRQGGRIMGQELHDLLRSSAGSAKASLMSSAAQSISQQKRAAQEQYNSQISSAQSRYNASKAGMINRQGEIQRAQAAIGLQKEKLNSFKAQEKKYLVDLSDRYNKKIEKLREVMSGVSVNPTEKTDVASVFEQVANQGKLEGDPTLTEQVIEGDQVQVPQAEAQKPEEMIEEEQA